MNTNTTVKLQVIVGGRLKAAHAQLERARLREKVIRDLCVDGDGLQAVAKRHRILYNEVLDLVLEQGRIDVDNARKAGFRDGLNAARFGPLPPTTARRAA